MDYNKRVTGFTKLFSTIVHSTVWREPAHVKVVWITMLAIADRNGHVMASLPGLADLSRVTVPECREAIAKFLSPDPDSRTKDAGGRRVEEIDGGWRLLNYLKYREMRHDDERRIQTREAVARFRDRKAKELTVSQGKPLKAHAEAEAEAEAEKKNSCPPPADDFKKFYSIYPKKRKRRDAERAWSKLSEEQRALAVSDVSKRPMSDPEWIKSGGEFIPHPASYLRGAMWEDEWSPVAQDDPLMDEARELIRRAK